MSAAQSGQPSEWARFLTSANQLVCQPGLVTDHTFEITFLDSGVQADAFTFG
jgi:hypothetical protein